MKMKKSCSSHAGNNKSAHLLLLLFHETKDQSSPEHGKKNQGAAPHRLPRTPPITLTAFFSQDANLG